MKKWICLMCILVLSGIGSMETYAGYNTLLRENSAGADIGENAEMLGGGYGAKEEQVVLVSSDYGARKETQQRSANATSVLIVGNSFSRNQISSNVTLSIERPLVELAAMEGRSLEVTTLAYGGAKLAYYAGMKEKYVSYNVELINLLENRKFDYIIFQEWTAGAIECLETMTVPALEQLQHMVKELQPQATMLLYMNAGYSNGKTFNINGNEKQLTTEQMELYLAVAFKELESRLGIEAIMVGMHSNRISRLYPTIELTRHDNKHPKYVGYYLAACCFYYRIYGTLPNPQRALLSNCNLSQAQLNGVAAMPADSMVMNKKNIVLKQGRTSKLRATVSSHLPNSSKVTYKSFDPAVASVNAKTGVVRAKKAGSTVIYAQTQDGLQSFCNVTVKQSIYFSRNYYLAGAGDKIKIKPQTSQVKLKWSSSKKKVASVNAKTGIVKAKRPGKAVIKATNKDNPTEKASYILYVTCDQPEKVKAYSVHTRNTAAGEMKISWEAVSGASCYEIYRCATKKGNYRLIGTSKTTSYLDKTALVNKNYYYKVAARTDYEQCLSSLSKSARGKRGLALKR